MCALFSIRSTPKVRYSLIFWTIVSDKVHELKVIIEEACLRTFFASSHWKKAKMSCRLQFTILLSTGGLHWNTLQNIVSLLRANRDSGDVDGAFLKKNASEYIVNKQRASTVPNSDLLKVGKDRCQT